jgi:hypothetical protein
MHICSVDVISADTIVVKLACAVHVICFQSPGKYMKATIIVFSLPLHSYAKNINHTVLIHIAYNLLMYYMT